MKGSNNKSSLANSLKYMVYKTLVDGSRSVTLMLPFLYLYYIQETLNIESTFLLINLLIKDMSYCVWNYNWITQYRWHDMYQLEY